MIWLTRRIYTSAVGDPSRLAYRALLPDTAPLQNHLLDSLVPAAFGDPPPRRAPRTPPLGAWTS
ncbi:hypothetical protein ACIGT4_18915 [Streptomyces sioyaensis]|uniref:hypothetical protein n=1 Tax=Streptomyces sioyaensis TaxID=67364 RepID=UPI0037D952D9